MSRDKIRLRYTGLIAFSSRIFSILTGLIFVVVVTRNVSSADFGVWQYISVLISYIVFPMGGVNYWATRDVARGVRGAAITCLALNLAISLVGMALFVSLSKPGADFLSTNPIYFLVSGVTVLAMAAIGSLEAIAYGAMPQVPSYGFIVFEITKVLLGLVTIIFLDMGLLGAMITVFLAYLVQTFVLIVLLRGEFREGFDNTIAVRWLKRLWLPIVSNFTGVISSLNVTIMVLLVESTEPVAYSGAAQTIAVTISYSSLMASALYPRLLRGGGERDITASLKLVTMVGLPMMAGVSTLASPLLSILQHQYAAAAPILIVLAASTFMGCLYSIMNSIITGTEKIDMDKDVSFKKILSSRLFFPAKVSYITTISYVVGTFAMSLYLVNLNSQPLSLYVPLAVAIVGFLITLPTFIYTWVYAKRVQPFRFPIGSFLRQVAATAAMVVVLRLFYPSLFAETLFAVLYGFLAYFAVLLLIDGDVRALTHAISNEAISRLKSH